MCVDCSTDKTTRSQIVFFLAVAKEDDNDEDKQDFIIFYFTLINHLSF